MKENEYDLIIVESFVPQDLRARHGDVHIRPAFDQGEFKTTMYVECSKKLSKDYPVGTRFQIKGKITRKEGGTLFIYSNYRWKFEVL